MMSIGDSKSTVCRERIRAATARERWANGFFSILLVTNIGTNNKDRSRMTHSLRKSFQVLPLMLATSVVALGGPVHNVTIDTSSIAGIDGAIYLQFNPYRATHCAGGCSTMKPTRVSSIESF